MNCIGLQTFLRGMSSFKTIACQLQATQFILIPAVDQLRCASSKIPLITCTVYIIRFGRKCKTR